MATKLTEHVAEAVRTRRIARKWSQELLAQRAGIAKGTLVKLETCQRKSVNLDTLEMIAQALEVDLVRLIVPPEADETLDEYIKSPWGQISKPDEREKKWLRELAPSRTLGKPASPKAVDHLLLAKRAEE